jgi:hypothetical protein
MVHFLGVFAGLDERAPATSRQRAASHARKPGACLGRFMQSGKRWYAYLAAILSGD